ncbi:MAG TPA: UbiX family flavin prenyltransferase [Vicinamibacterales bacterium]|nr:UbiX family flavin prenyltransferase [Vicinamibacterales bacterium]
MTSGDHRLIVGITGATGVVYGVRLLERLQPTGIETHLVLSRWAARTLLHETGYTPEAVERLATRSYPPAALGAAIASGSFLTRGMVIVPCSMRTLSAIAHGQGENLIHRAADVTLKERRRLVLVVREAPLSEVHLDNMLRLARMGAVICPPVPAFYHRPRTLDEVIDYTVGRILDQVGVHLELPRWDGAMARGPRE